MSNYLTPLEQIARSVQLARSAMDDSEDQAPHTSIEYALLGIGWALISQAELLAYNALEPRTYRDYFGDKT